MSWTIQLCVLWNGGQPQNECPTCLFKQLPFTESFIYLRRTRGWGGSLRLVRRAPDWEWRMMKLRTHQSEAGSSLLINPCLNTTLWLLCRAPHLELVQLPGHTDMVEHDSGSAGLGFMWNRTGLSRGQTRTWHKTLYEVLCNRIEFKVSLCAPKTPQTELQWSWSL